MVRSVATDWRTADLNAADQALCEFAEKLTASPASMSEQDVIRLRQAGFDDPAIHDAAQVVAYFNYINRVADALEVDEEDFVEHWDKPLLG
ncbi:MAG: hypothetical protein AB8G99_00295 [Planctomycetaceae bacterium]